VASSTTSIRIPNDVKRALELIKRELGLRSLGESIRVLMQLGESPLALIALLFDLRSDVKGLLTELKRLNDNLEKLLKAVEGLRVG